MMMMMMMFLNSLCLIPLDKLSVKRFYETVKKIIVESNKTNK